MGSLFGTDGVRGIANQELTCGMAYHLGQAAVGFLGPKIIIGRDTRISGDMLEAAAAAGIMSAGGTVLTAGIIPTPAVALLTRELHCDGGLVISASHNPPQYNGIKFFDREGFKLPDSLEESIGSFVLAGGLEAGAPSERDVTLALGDGVGTKVIVEDGVERYVDHVVRSVTDQGVDFSGLSIALDTGHGAASLTTPAALERLGAAVTVINDSYNGRDINVECGSTHLEALEALMGETGADVGIAHDGDADRVMIMAPGGEVLDGDFMAATLALDMRDRGVLPRNTVVSTVMANLGFMEAMEREGITVVQTSVGDRYVLEEMRREGYGLGGEQSGHMILLTYNSTGDGLMTACQYLAALRRKDQTLTEAAQVMERFPQTLVNVRVADKGALEGNGAIQEAIAAGERALGGRGRVLVRPSGTEPLVRVMVEAKSADDAQAVADAIARTVEEQLA